MSLKIKPRGKRYWAVGTIAGRVLRLSLGTANRAAALKWVDHIERAMAGGSSSALWPELKRVLPPNTFEVLAGIANYLEEAPPKVWTWGELQATFEVEMRRRILLEKLADSTWQRYEQTLRAFTAFVGESGVCILAEKELRDRARRIMENGEGLEKTHCTKIAQSKEGAERIH